MPNTYYVYIISNKRNGTLYIGMTGDIERRILEHKNKIFEGFSKKYDLNILVYFEEHQTYQNAKQREFQLKKWRREWKIDLIHLSNPMWVDLSSEWY
ncbi:MAG: GIY-YIG nuclease family protein [Flavobacteriales bacterium]